MKDKQQFYNQNIMTQREVSSCQHKQLNGACKKCGVCLYPNDKALKTQVFESFLNCAPKKYLKNLRKRQTALIDVKEINESTALLLDAICEKFEYGIETRALGMYIFAKACDKPEVSQKFWASCCLMVASKGIELDKRVPYLNRYQRYADKSFPQEEYQLGQKVIFEQMKFNIQFATFVTFLHFYMTAGIVFESDQLSDFQVKAIEDDLALKVKTWIRHGAFLNHDPENLALALIKEVRAKFKLQLWHENLQQLSGISEDKIKEVSLERPTALRQINNLQFREKNNSISNGYETASPYTKNPLLSSIQKTQPNNEPRLMKFNRKKMESTLKFTSSNIKENCVNENSIKLAQQPLSSKIRPQNYSLSKISLSASSDRLMTFNMFASRR